jgi:transposase, IS5 family
MRRLYHDQLPLCPSEAQHPRAAELAEMSRLLDAVPHVLGAVRQDLAGRRKVSVKKGREGLSAEQVLRAGLVKQMFGVSYDELAFHLEDSLQLRAFCRLSPSVEAPRKSALQANIGAIRAQTWQTVNEALMLEGKGRKVEDGRWMRTDATVVESNIHPPLDSWLLWDGVRVLTRILARANEDFGTTYCHHARRAKRRSVAILHAGTMERRLPLYRDLLKVTKKTVFWAEKVKKELEAIGGFKACYHAASLAHFLPLVGKVIDQTERRVLRHESVPAQEKIVSIFEPHTDIIRKDRRDTHYGHKVTLSTGRSGMVLDVVIEDGNPADSTLAIRSAERHAALFGAPPDRVAFDGGFASKNNLRQIKQAGTTEVCFSKPAGVPVAEMTTTPRIRRSLKCFRAGIEAGISFLKRSFGWERVTWTGLPRFHAYVWCSAVAHNLLVFARALLARRAPLPA